MTNYLKSKNAITLIALIITIIILIILAGVLINLTLGDNGLFNQAKKSKEKYSFENEKEQLEIAIANFKIQKLSEGESNILLNDLKDYLESSIFNGKYSTELLYEDLENSEIISQTALYLIVTPSATQFKFYIDNNLVIVGSEKSNSATETPQEQNNNPNMNIYDITKNDSILGYIAKNITRSGYFDNIKINNETYNIHAIVLDGDIVFNGTSTIEGITLNDKIYEIGDATKDAATGNETDEQMAKYTVVLRVKGNITVNSDVTLTACKSADGFGGPKGLIVYCDGTLTNNGKITMTARGAYANGQNIYLWKNSNNSYEMITSNGGAGGNGGNSSSALHGEDGSTAGNRATGGGGGGRRILLTWRKWIIRYILFWRNWWRCWW